VPIASTIPTPTTSAQSGIIGVRWTPAPPPAAAIFAFASIAFASSVAAQLRRGIAYRLS
jgi:hypothetical protein